MSAWRLCGISWDDSSWCKGKQIQQSSAKGFINKVENNIQKLWLVYYTNNTNMSRWMGEGTVLARRPWLVSPPILGGLDYGDRMICDTFPLVWGTL